MARLGIRVLVCLGFCAAVLAATAPAASASIQGDWRQSGYSAQHAGYQPYETVLSRANVAHLRVKWNTTLPSSIAGEPAVVGSRVFVGTADGHLYCLARSDGRVLWSVNTLLPIGATPAVWGDEVIVGGGERDKTSFVAAYTVNTGHILWWSASYGSTQDVAYPTVYNGTIFVSTAQLVRGITLAGHVLWTVRITTGGPSDTVSGFIAAIPGPVAVSAGGKYVLAITTDGNLAALDAVTLAGPGYVGGWGQKLGRGAMHGGPAIAGGVVYVASESAASPAWDIYAARISDGHVLWRAGAGVEVHATPTVAGGVVYVGQVENRVRAFSARTGARIWSVPVNGEVLNQPALANGVLYVGTDKSLLALDARNGKRLFRASYPGAKPAVSSGWVFVNYGSHVAALGLP